MTTKSFAVEVQADASATWRGNAIRLRGRENAEAYARDLMYRWTTVRAWRVIESADKATHDFNTIVYKLTPLAR